MYADPLVIYPPAYSLIEYDSYLDNDNSEPFVFPVSPDLDFKHGFGGGGYDGVVISGFAVDADYTLTGSSFMSYLRLSFDWGGFPGWRKHPLRPVRELKFLADGLLPL